MQPYTYREDVATATLFFVAFRDIQVKGRRSINHVRPKKRKKEKKERKKKKSMQVKGSKICIRFFHITCSSVENDAKSIIPAKSMYLRNSSWKLMIDMSRFRDL